MLKSIKLKSKSNRATIITIQKIAIILNSSSNWEVWINMIRNQAKIANVWQFIDLLIKKENLPTLLKPTLPLSKNVNSVKILISDLTITEIEELKVL